MTAHAVEFAIASQPLASPLLASLTSITCLDSWRLPLSLLPCKMHGQVDWRWIAGKRIAVFPLPLTKGKLGGGHFIWCLSEVGSSRHYMFICLFFTFYLYKCLWPFLNCKLQRINVMTIWSIRWSLRSTIVFLYVVWFITICTYWNVIDVL